MFSKQKLGARVDGEADLGSDAGLGVVGHADGAALFVLHDGFLAFRSAQDLVHGRLHAGDALLVADVVVELAGGALRDVALFPLFQIAEHVAGERSVGILPLGAEARIDAGQFQVVLREFRELLVGEIRPVAVGDESAVGEEMGAKVAGLEVPGELEFRIAEHVDGAVLDDRDDVLFRLLARESLLRGEAVDGGVLDVLREIGLADFIEVEGDLVAAGILGEGDAVAVGDLPADAGLAHGDGAVSGDELEEIIPPDDLEFMEA